MLDHHERLDGGGYPRGLTRSELDLDTRILTVCDVYDALISPRVYRAAWTHEQALALLREETGTAFDHRCVAALERVLARERADEARGRRLESGLLRPVRDELGRRGRGPGTTRAIAELRRLLHPVVHRVDQRDAGRVGALGGTRATCSCTKSSRQFVAALPVT